MQQIYSLTNVIPYNFILYSLFRWNIWFCWFSRWFKNYLFVYDKGTLSTNDKHFNHLFLTQFFFLKIWRISSLTPIIFNLVRTTKLPFTDFAWPFIPTMRLPAKLSQNNYAVKILILWFAPPLFQANSMIQQVSKFTYHHTASHSLHTIIHFFIQHWLSKNLDGWISSQQNNLICHESNPHTPFSLFVNYRYLHTLQEWRGLILYNVLKKNKKRYFSLLLSVQNDREKTFIQTHTDIRTQSTSNTNKQLNRGIVRNS